MFIQIPFIGEVYAQHERLTPWRWEVEFLHDHKGFNELLLCAGHLRIYLTPWSSVIAPLSPPETEEKYQARVAATPDPVRWTIYASS